MGSAEIEQYLHALRSRIEGEVLERVRIPSPSLLRSYDPPVSALEGRRILDLERLGKRIVWAMEGDLFAVFHLMVAGRFKWRAAGVPIPRKGAHGAFDFEAGTLLLTESGTRKKATLHVVRTREALADLDPGGLEVMGATPEEFGEALRRENRTLKRALTDPRLLSGIGNAHSDEILLFAGLSPVRLTSHLSDGEIERLFQVDGSVPPGVGRASSSGGRRRLPGEGHGLPSWDGRSREVRRALPGMLHTHPADRLCREGDRLLPHVSDRREAPGGSRPVSPSEGGLAEDAGRAGGDEARAAAGLGGFHLFDPRSGGTGIAPVAVRDVIPAVYPGYPWQ